mmetsp:Transcript_9103/g.20891  ORF Transcript_9103/g.20891 Transcript_9103/m.20891 type:complete len:424 (-) Transcript_9103:101-1372(-)
MIRKWFAGAAFTSSLVLAGFCLLVLSVMSIRTSSQREARVTIAPGFHPAAAYMASALHNMKADSDQEIHFGHVRRRNIEVRQLSDRKFNAREDARYAILSRPIPPIPHMKEHVQTRAEIEKSFNSDLFHTTSTGKLSTRGSEGKTTEKTTDHNLSGPKNLVHEIPRDMFEMRARVTSLASDVLSKKGVNVGYQEPPQVISKDKKDKLEDHGVYTDNRFYHNLDDVAVPLEGIDANGYGVHPDAHNRDGYTVNEYWPLQANKGSRAMQTKLASTLEDHNGIPELHFSHGKLSAHTSGRAGGSAHTQTQFSRGVKAPRQAQAVKGVDSRDEAWLAAGSQQPLGVENVVNSANAAEAMEDGDVDAKEKSDAMANLRNAMLDSHQSIPGHRERSQIRRPGNPCQEQQPYESYFAYKFRLAHGETSQC